MIVSVILAVAVFCGAYQNPPAKSGAATPQPAAQQKDTGLKVPEGYVIGLNDVLSIGVWKEPDHSAPRAVVRPDGMITMPMIGDVKAVGLTTKQLEEEITSKLTVLVAPAVTVTVLEIQSLYVTITGNVAKQGAYPLTSPMTVLELIGRAGGIVPDYAHGNRIKIIRKDGTLKYFNYNDVINGRSLKQNIFLEPGDIIIVP